MLKKYFICFLTIIFSFIILLSSSLERESNSLIFPIHSSYYISSTFGYRTLGTKHMHNGIDIPKTVGTPIYPISSGVISYIGFSSSYGHYIIINYTNGYKTLYGHLSGEYPYSIGSNVNYTDIIGYIGPKYLSNGKLNGFTTGPHLHFTLYKDNKLINPESVTFKYKKTNA